MKSINILRMRKAASAAFTPADLAPDVVTWFDPASGITYQTNPSVQSWASKVGSVSLGFSSGYPQFAASVINGLPTLQGRATSGQSFLATYADTGPDFTVAWVGSMTNNGSAYGRLISFSDSAIAADWNNTSGFNVGRNNLTTGLNLAYNSGGSGDFVATYGAFFIGVVQFTGSQASLYINGTLVGSITATANLNINRMGLWRDASTPSGVSVGAGDFAELLTMSRAPTTTERQKLEGYFAWKFALTGVLPGGHPYKTVAP